jgi:hypothetical protein
MIRPDTFSRVAALVAAVALPVTLWGCTIQIAGGEGCKVGARTYAIGETMPSPDGCNTCTCTADGASACTEMDCVDGCVDDQNVTHAVGESWAAGDGCNTCFCGAPDVIACTHQSCDGPCVWNGQTYQVGDAFAAGDGCNDCTCESGGLVSCTLIWCTTCTYAGAQYNPGESFPALDGCNACTCDDTGNVGCTKIGCACDPTKEWWRSYVSTDPAQCLVIDYGCPNNTTGFSNECGCGCEQDASCPQWFDCMPPSPCDVTKLKEQCPYSGIAL